MLNKFFAVAASLLLGACAPISHDLNSYLTSFKAEARERGVEINERVDVQFVTTLGDAGAKCYGDARVILVSRQFWDDSFWSEDTRRQAIYHEFGHCLLHLPHDPSLLRNRPQSMMYPELVGGPWYAAHEAIYLDRLFATAKESPGPAGDSLGVTTVIGVFP